MNNVFEKTMLNIIESRDTPSSEIHTGIVTGILNNNKRANIKLAGGKESFNLINKTGELLSVGDSVYVKTNNGKMTGAYVFLRFGEPIWAGGAGSSTSNYDSLGNRPAINGVTLSGNRTAAQLQLQLAGEYLTKEYQVITDSKISELTSDYVALKQIVDALISEKGVI